MLFLPSPKKGKMDLRIQVFGFFFLCMPIFGLQEDTNISFRLLKLYFVVLVCVILFIYIFRVYKEGSRALIFIGTWLVPILLLLFLHYVRIIEFLSYIFTISKSNLVFISSLILVVSIVWMYELYKKQKSYMSDSLNAGLLERFKIFDKNNGVFNPNIYYPGLDGTSPDEKMKIDYSKWMIITAIPLSGLTFLFLRTISNSIFWIIFLLCFFGYVMLMFLGAKAIAVWVQLLNWEKQIGKKIQISLI